MIKTIKKMGNFIISSKEGIGRKQKGDSRNTKTFGKGSIDWLSQILLWDFRWKTIIEKKNEQ